MYEDLTCDLWKNMAQGHILPFILPLVLRGAIKKTKQEKVGLCPTFGDPPAPSPSTVQP